MKTTFIINPKSGKGFDAQRIKGLRQQFSKAPGEFDYQVGKNREDLILKTRKALLSGSDQIVAVGGDGTVNAVVNGFFEQDKAINSAAKLCIFPTGTGCDYFKTIINGSYEKDWSMIFLNHEVRDIDVGRISFLNTKTSPTYFINITGIGISSVIVEMKNSGPHWLPKSLSYVYPAIKSLLSYEAPLAKITTDHESFDCQFIGIFVAKGLFSGGGMKFGGAVGLADGLLDITIFEDMPPVERVIKMGKLFTGNFSREDRIRKIISKKILVQSKKPIPIEFDGEAVGETDIEITLLGKSIKVCFPIKDEGQYE